MKEEIQAQNAYLDQMVSSKTPFIRQDVINHLEDRLRAEVIQLILLQLHIYQKGFLQLLTIHLKQPVHIKFIF